MPTLATSNLFDAAAACLAEPDPERKCDLTARAAAAWGVGALDLDPVNRRLDQHLAVVPAGLLDRRLELVEVGRP